MISSSSVQLSNAVLDFSWRKNTACACSDFEALDAKASVFAMILKPGRCKKDSIYNDFQAWDVKATAFAMILKPGMQKR